MRAPLRRQTQLIGSKWLREEGDSSSWNKDSNEEDGKGSVKVVADPKNQECNLDGWNHGGSYVSKDTSGSHGVLNKKDKGELAQDFEKEKAGIAIIENKKRRTNVGLDQQFELGLDTGLNETKVDEMDQDLNKNPILQLDPKYGYVAGSTIGVRPQQ